MRTLQLPYKNLVTGREEVEEIREGHDELIWRDETGSGNFSTPESR